MSDLDVVTGAFSYTGRHSAEALLDRDRCEEWLERSGRELGRTYASELAHNFRGYEAS